MRTGCIVKLSKVQIYELNTLVQKETSDHVEGKPPPSDRAEAGELQDHETQRFGVLPETAKGK
jgi:hypothetical protein